MLALQSLISSQNNSPSEEQGLFSNNSSDLFDYELAASTIGAPGAFVFTDSMPFFHRRCRFVHLAFADNLSVSGLEREIRIAR